MADFNPDEFLAGGTAVAEPAFDPDAFLNEEPFDPDAFLADAPATKASPTTPSPVVSSTVGSGVDAPTAAVPENEAVRLEDLDPLQAHLAAQELTMGPGSIVGGMLLAGQLWRDQKARENVSDGPLGELIEIPYPESSTPGVPQAFTPTSNAAANAAKSIVGGAASGTSDIVGGAAQVASGLMTGGSDRQDIVKYEDRIAGLSKKKSLGDDFSEEQLKSMTQTPEGYRTPKEEADLAVAKWHVRNLRRREVENAPIQIPLQDVQRIASLASKESQTFFGQDPQRQDEFLSKLATGVGSLPPYIAGAMAGGPAVSMLIGSLQSGQSEYNAAINAGRPDLADEAMEKGLLIGMSEGVGIGGGLSAPAKSYGQKAIKFLLNGFKEGGQEWVQTTLSNLNANTLTGYDPERPMFEGSGDAALIGTILGVAVEGTNQAVRRAPPEAIALSKAAESASETLPLAAAEAEKLAAQIAARAALKNAAAETQSQPVAKVETPAITGETPAPIAETKAPATEVQASTETLPAGVISEAAIPTTEPTASTPTPAATEPLSQPPVEQTPALAEGAVAAGPESISKKEIPKETSLPDELKSVEERIANHIREEKPLAYGSRGDGEVTAGYDLGVGQQVKLKLTSAEKKELAHAEADLKFSETQAERTAAKDRIQNVLRPATERAISKNAATSLEPTTTPPTASATPSAGETTPTVQPAEVAAPSSRRLALERLESAETELADDPAPVSDAPKLRIIPKGKRFQIIDAADNKVGKKTYATEAAANQAVSKLGKRSTFGLPPSQNGNDIIDAIIEQGGINLSGLTKEERDNVFPHKGIWRNALTTTNSNMTPDEVARLVAPSEGQSGHGDGDMRTMFGLIDQAIASRSRLRDQTRANEANQKAEVKKARDFEKSSRTQSPGSAPISVNEMKVGEVYEIAGETVEVVDVNEDGDVMVDGERSGLQALSDGSVVFGKVISTVESPVSDSDIDPWAEVDELTTPEQEDAYVEQNDYIEATASSDQQAPASQEGRNADGEGQGGAGSTTSTPAGNAVQETVAETPLEKARRVVSAREDELATSREEGDYELAASLSRVLPKLRRDLAEAERKASEATPEPATPPAAAEPVEIWQRTRDSVGTMLAKHREAVKDAVARKKPVPDEVLAEYSGSAWADKEISKRNKAAKQAASEPSAKPANDAQKSAESPPKGSTPLDRSKIAAMSDDQLASRLGALRIFMQEKMESGDAVDPNAVENVARLYSEARKRDLVDAEPTIDAYIDKESGSPSLPKLREGKSSDDLLQGDNDVFNLVSETAADKAARLKREQAEEKVKAEKEAAEAKALQDKQQTSLFDQPQKNEQTQEVEQEIESHLSSEEKTSVAQELGQPAWSDKTAALFRAAYADWLVSAKAASDKLARIFERVLSATKTGLMTITVALSFGHDSTSRGPDIAANEIRQSAQPAIEQKAEPVSEPEIEPPSEPIIQEGPLVVVEEVRPPEIAPEKSADFVGETASEYTQDTADWIIRTGDNEGRSFAVADKTTGTIYFFDGEGKLSKKAPALFGREVGDTSSKGRKITPSGRFKTAIDEDPEGQLGKTVDFAEAPSGNAIAIHRLYLGDPSEKRPQRLASDDASRRRISYGCINVDGKLMDSVVLPLFEGGGTVYVLPETASGKSAFEGMKKSRTPDKVEALLNKAIKGLETNRGQMFADPLFIQSVGKPALRAALKIVLAAYKGGKLAADAIAEGMAYLRANVANLDEKKAQEFFEGYYEPEESAPAPNSAAPTPPLETPAETALPPIPETTAAYNEETDKLLAAGGFEPIAKPARKALGTSWDEAQQQVAADTDKGSRLVEELNANPRTLVDDVESGVLLHELATRKAEQVKAQEALFAVVDGGDADAISDAKARLEKARTRTFEAITAAKLTGTAWGRAGRFRQVHLDQDFSLVAMEAAWRSEVNGGKPLTPDQSKLIAELHKKIAESEAKVAAFEAKEAEAEAKRVFDEVIREAKKEAAAAKKTGNRVATFLHEQAAKARARIIARRGKLFSTIDPLNIAGLVDEAIIGADHIANGLKELKAWSAAMIKDFGERLRPALPALFEKSKEYHQTIETEIAAKTAPKGKKAPAAAETPDSLLASAKPGAPLDPKLVFDLARAHVRAGVVGMEAVMKAVHADLAPLHEGLTEREVRDAFSGYGKVTFPSREEDLTALREYKTLARLTSQLEDAQKRVAPLKTGPQRDKATQAVRDLTKQVKETMRRLGIETTTPEQQLKTSLDAVKARLQNQIEDLNKQISTKKKPEGKTPIPYDDEAKALRAERDRLSALADEIFGKPEMTDAQRIAAATKALDRSIAEEDALLKAGILKRPAKESKTPLTPELEAKRAMLDSMRDLRRELADAENPKKSPEDRAMEAAFKAAQASLARYDEMLKSGNLKPAERAAKFTPSTELETLWNERNAVRDAVAELRRSQAKRTPPEEMARKAALKALDKRMEELDRRIKDGDFSDRPATPGKASKFDDVQDKRAEVKAMNELYRTLKKAQLPQRTPEEIQLARDKKLIAKRTEELKRRVAEGDYAPRVKKDPVMDAEKTKLLFENAKAKADYNRGLFEEQLKNRSIAKKIFDTAREVLNTSRAILTSFDVSAVFRQGGFIVFAHPVRGAASLGPMFKAFASEKAAFKVSNDIANRPNAPLYAKSKLFLAEGDSTSLTKQEENFMGRWAAKIPGVAGSQRAYTTFLNKLRADSFDAMLDTLGNGAATTPEEAAAIANFINVATGRGNIPGKAAQAAAGLNSIFFAPRYVLSRFQLLAGQPFYGGNAKTRALIAKEYGRYLIGVGIVYALAMAAMDDDDEPIETDPTSSNFLKARFGNTRLDPMSGLLQATVFAAREGEALRRFATGDASKDPKYGSGSDVLGRFLRSKLSPAVGSAVDMLAGKDVTGRRVTPEDSLKRMVTPLSVGDIAKTMEEQGVAKGTVMSLLSLLGMGVQTYEAKK